MKEIFTKDTLYYILHCFVCNECMLILKPHDLLMNSKSETIVYWRHPDGDKTAVTV